MDSRAQFEDWYFRRYGEKDLTKVRVHAEFCDAWEVWQASRAAIDVELPEKISRINKTDSGFVLAEAASYDEALDDCGQALVMIGLRYRFGAKKKDELPLQHEARDD